MKTLDHVWRKSKAHRPGEFQPISEILPTVLGWVAQRADRRELGLSLLRAGCPIAIIHRAIISQRAA